MRARMEVHVSAHTPAPPLWVELATQPLAPQQAPVPTPHQARPGQLAHAAPPRREGGEQKKMEEGEDEKRGCDEAGRRSEKRERIRIACSKLMRGLYAEFVCLIWCLGVWDAVKIACAFGFAHIYAVMADCVAVAFGV